MRSTELRMGGGLFVVLCSALLVFGVLPSHQSYDPGFPSAQIRSLSAQLIAEDEETRRNAVMRLGGMHTSEASRAAMVALRDKSSMVRAVATHSILAAPIEEVIPALDLMLRDRNPFVRSEAVDSLSQTRDKRAAPPLTRALEGDKDPSVRAAAAIGLGLIRDPSSVPYLANLLSPNTVREDVGHTPSRKSENEFIRRSAARSLGQIGSKEAVPSLIAAVSDQRSDIDVRREAAKSLGLIGDPAAASALRAAIRARDPYLSQLAYDALKNLGLQTF